MLCFVYAGKKRVATKSLWKHATIKRLKAAGKEHVNHRGKLVEARKQPEVVCRCNCAGMLDNDEKVGILANFNALADHTAQNLHLAGLTVPRKPKRSRSRTGTKKRVVTFDYFVEVVRESVPERIPVCKAAFLAFHGIAKSRLTRKVLQNRIAIQY